MEFTQQAKVVGGGLRNYGLRYGRTYHRALKQARDVDRYAAEAVHDLQSRALARLLHEARTGTEWYRRSLAHLSPDDLSDVVRTLDLRRLPLLDKHALRQDVRAFENRLRRGILRSSTSGTTGSPLSVRHDLESIQLAHALVHRQREWFCEQPRPRHVRASGRLLVPSGSDARPYMLNPAERQLLVSTYHLHGPALERIARAVARFRPVLLEGYPSALLELSRSRLVLPDLRAVITTAETVTPDARAELEEAYGVPVADYYSASEGVPILQQCEHGVYHVRPESGIVEILDPSTGAPCAAGATGELVLTSFRQWKTPLIRYRIGDSVRRREDEPCTCERPLPLVAEVHGRSEDSILTPDGRTIGMFSYRTMKYVEGIEASQILQHAPAHFEVRVVGAASEAVEHQVRSRLTGALGYPARIDVTYVPAVDRGPNGKVRAVVRTFQSHSPSGDA